MRPARTARMARTAVIVAAAASGLGMTPAAADGILVSPHTVHPGQRVHISVPDCSVGPTPHTAASEAFTRKVTLYGKADTGDADPRIKRDLRPGGYAITASCGNGRTVHGQVVVTAASEGGGHATTPPPVAVHTESASPPRSPDASISATPAASRDTGGGSTAVYWMLAAVVVLAGGAGVLVLRRRR